MSRKTDPSRTDDCVKKYVGGMSVPKIARETGVPRTVIFRALAAAGVKARPRKVDLPIAEIVDLYMSGLSEKALSERFGVHRNGIRRRLIEAGVSIRGQSEANALRMAALSTEELAAITAAAHAAMRGREKTLGEKIKHARTVMARGRHIVDSERELASLLAERGIGCTHQQAIGPYNCDLGAFPVAVEVFGGGWHWHGRHLLRTSERFRHILDAGWHIVCVKIDARFPLIPAAADYIATFIEQARREPTARRQYRVIRGAAELLAAGGADDDQISIIPALRSARNARGQYQGVPR